MTAINDGNLQIGWASKNVTPDRPVNLQGQFKMRISKGVKDPVMVTVLALTSGASADNTVVFVSCDSVSVPENVFRQCCAAISRLAPDLDTSRIVLNATHTHTAPGLSEGHYPPVPSGVMTATEYAEFFAGRAAEAVREAWENRKPGGISFGLGTAVVGHNRRATYFEDVAARMNEQAPGRFASGRTKMYGSTNDPLFSHIEGYEDHYVDLLYTWDAGKKLTGVVVNLACPSQETEGDYYVSADFWHEIRQEIKKRHGDEIQILAQCSPAGDQSPHRLWYKQAEERMLELRKLDMRREIGRRVANAVDEVLPPVREAVQTNPPLRHVVKEIQLPRRMISDEEAEQARADLVKLEAGDKTEGHYFAGVRRCKNALARYEAQKSGKAIPMELHVIRLGDVAFATNRYEYFLDFGIRIKARSPAVQTFLVQLTTDRHGAGTYLPTERAVAGKGYGGGAYDNEVGPEGGQVIVEETVGLLKELWPARNASHSDAGGGRKCENRSVTARAAAESGGDI